MINHNVELASFRDVDVDVKYAFEIEMNQKRDEIESLLKLTIRF